jgi:hypothetical protein
VSSGDLTATPAVAERRPGTHFFIRATLRVGHSQSASCAVFGTPLPVSRKAVGCCLRRARHTARGFSNLDQELPVPAGFNCEKVLLGPSRDLEILSSGKATLREVQSSRQAVQLLELQCPFKQKLLDFASVGPDKQRLASAIWTAWSIQSPRSSVAGRFQV